MKTIMKKSILLFAGIILMLGAKAQFPMGGPAKKMVTGRITAIILDSASRKPIDYATVSLLKTKDNKSVNGAVTDERGKKTLSNVSH
jgi:phosphoglucomutase